MDYVILDSSEEKVNQGVRDKSTKQALNDRIIMSWEEISVEEICKSISVWKKWFDYSWRKIEATLSIE